ncbi:WhiB family transcriptional regulator [Streptomyces xanthochromogenes]|uniref:WhiB family transcriptional regulator n=1 Tax=Streptomyces xanthochromogenes TaxID=67384 RepID=UPI00342AB47E
MPLITTPTAYGRRDTWRAHAACSGIDDPDIMFPDTSPFRARLAAEVCEPCPVRQACLTDAFTHQDDYSVRAGTTAKNRRDLQRRLPDRSAEELAEYVCKHRPGQVDLGVYLAARTEVLPDGHARWVSTHSTLLINGQSFTPMKLAFTLGYGRRPEGTVKAVCGVNGCLTPDHLTDQVMRGGRSKRTRPREKATA